MHDTLSRRWLLIVVAVGLAGVAWGYTSARANDGCGPVAGPIIQSKDFTPRELRRGWIDPPLNREGDSLANLDEFDGVTEIAGLPLWWVDRALTDDYLSEGAYYLDAPVGSMLVSEFVDAGGVQFSKESVFDESNSIAARLTRAGDRGIAVDVGSHDGMLVWADPDQSGTRTHNLYWSDGAFDYALIADRGAEEILALGRTLVCSG